MKISHLFIIASLLLLVNISLASSVGIISPPGMNRNYIFEPNMNINFQLNALNTLSKAKIISFYADGDLAEYVTFSPTEQLVDEGQSKPFFVSINLPEGITPGLHTIYVGALEQVPDSEAQVAVRAGVRIPIRIRARHPGKYVETDLSMSNPAVGEPAEAKVSVKNYGSEYITSARADLTFYTMDNQVMAQASTNNLPVEVDKSITLEASVSTDSWSKGEYFTNGTLFYDGNAIELDSEKFLVGDLYIDIINYTDKFQKGIIQKFDVVVKNDWNRLIEDAYCQISILKDGNVIDTLKSPDIDIPDFSEAKMTAYWDLRDLDTGKYQADITVFYRDNSTNKLVDIEVFEDLGLVDQKPKTTISLTTVMFGSIILLIIINILLFWYLRKKEQAPEKPKKK